MSAMTNDNRRNIEGIIFFVLFCLTIPAANWMIGHVGTYCSSHGPCLVPVAPGGVAPSGVLMIGAALVLRDLAPPGCRIRRCCHNRRCRLLGCRCAGVLGGRFGRGLPAV
jgi:hypothetical protein